MAIFSHRFSKYEDGTMKKIFTVDSEPECVYRISILEEDWDQQKSRLISRWIKNFRNGQRDIFRWGILERIQKDNTFSNESTLVCSFCKKCFRHRSGLSKHKKICKNIPCSQITISQKNKSSTMSSTVISSVTDEMRSFGRENPRWVTSELLYGVLSNLPSAIPIMMRTKHFNDKFPENRNIRIDTKRNLEHRLQVFEEGRWMVKGSKQTFYKVLIDICDILSDALEEDRKKYSDEDEDDMTEGDDYDEEQEDGHIGREIRRLRNSDHFIRKINRIRPIWEKFREKIDDSSQRVDLWEDLKTLLLDRQLAIEQGFT